MPEDQDKNQKTKATLIKHEKSEESKNSDAHVKKKRVVVSSSGTAPKKVVVKRRTPKVVAKKAPTSGASDNAKQDTQAKSPAKPAVDNIKEQSKPVEKRNETPNQQSGGYQGSGQRQGGYQGGGQRQGGYQGGGQRQGGYQGGGQRPGGYQGGGQRQGGYQGGGQRQGGYQGGGQRQGGYQGGGQRQGGYQGGGQRPGGYQGGGQRQGGYQGGGQRQGGYQGGGQRQGGYQGGGQRQGGYQGGGQRPGGYQGGGQRQGGYQGGGQRQGGYQGGGQRQGGYQGGGQRQGGYQGGGQRPGGYQGGSGSSAPAGNDQKKSSAKKFFKSKKNTQYGKKKNVHSERNYEYKKKIVNNTNPVPKEISMMEVITVSELARKMNLKASDLISKLMKMGMMVTINQQIDFETSSLLAEEYNCKVKLVSLYDETLIETEKDKDEDLVARPPIVTVMGHVDHGKTKLLDAIRQTNVVDGEFGGITQHIGAYTVNTDKGKITFLDTPGHAAFTLMRARGAQITDVVVLVVAANDGVMPQTIEAINHAKEAEVPIIVAVNKVDLPEANIDRVKQQLSEYNLISEDWGGSTQFIELSALKRLGIDKLLDSISLEAELLELKANFTCNAEGKIIESKVDQGRGIVSSVLIERGTLRIGDSFVAGIYHGKVRAMFNDRGQKVQMADPSMPVEILGLSGIPDSGDPFQVTENEKIARQFGLKRQELKKHEEAKNVKKITLANLYDSIQDGEMQELKVIIKGDVHGSVEALKQTLEKLSTPEIRLVCIHSSAGAIIENDVSLAAASNAIIVGFHVRPTPKAQLRADQEKVEIKKYNIIYDAVEDIRSAMEGMLAPELKEEIVGQVEVRETFKVPKIGTIAGCMVTSGLVTRKSQIHMYREGIEIFTGAITALKRFKDDAKEVKEGFECGISLENFSDIKVGDVFEVFEMKEIAKKLGDPIDK